MRVRVAVVAMLETFAAEAVLVQLVRLQHGAHAAVENQDAPLQRLLQQGDAIGMEPGQGTHCSFLLRKHGLRIAGRFKRACAPAG